MRQLLAKSPPFSALNKSEITRLVARAEEILFKKGQTVFEEGAPAKYVWVIKSGWIRLTKKSSAEKSVTIDLLSPREALCGVSVFDRLPYSATATAITPASVVKIPSLEVLHLLESNPLFGQQLVSLCCHRIRHMAESCAMLYEPASCRIAKTLLHLKDLFGEVLPITHKEIAGITGIRVETTIRIMAQMKKSGWLQMSRGRITIVRSEQIKSMLVTNRRQSCATVTSAGSKAQALPIT